MKTLVLLVAVVFSAPVFADVCGVHVQCGTFKGKGHGKDFEGNILYGFSESITITETGPKTASLLIVVAEKSQDEQVYDLTMTFQDDGRFEVTSERGLYARGMCREMVCTYGMYPSAKLGNSGVLRFKNGNLERYMLVVTPKDHISQLSALEPK